ncbi:MAG: universal stress protein [Bacteroidota bacterium]
MYQHVLVPVDGSQTSDLALREAIKLIGSNKAELWIVHVVEAVMPLLDVELLNVDELRKAVHDAGRKILARAEAAAREAGITAKTTLIEARAGARIANVIADEARGWPADLIVIGTHGRRGVDHLLLGSVAEGVIRSAPAPVLLIRSK